MTTASPSRQDAKESAEFQALRGMIPLDNLTPRSLRFVASKTKLLSFKKDEVLFDIGDTMPFTYYLVEGAIGLKDAKDKRVIVASNTERGRYAISNLVPRHFQAWVVSDTATIARVDRDLLEKEIAWGQVSADSTNGDIPLEQDWRLDLLRTPVFAKLPMANVQKLFAALEEFPCQAGSRIIKEGDPGDYFYIIRSGTCKVMRNTGGRRMIALGTLESPNVFGDEALVSNKPRNATVVMETAGMLMRLSKAHFEQLMHKPLVKKVKLTAIESAIAKGKAFLLDVRMEEEFAENRIPYALNIPLFLLHLKTQTMSKQVKYIVYCDTGSRSEAAAFLLTRYGFDVYLLDDASDTLAATQFSDAGEPA
jgi:CRP-like cAMP-binding protein